MERALALARQALGTTSPNPAVGAVVVRDGAIVGEGHTMPPGQRHAEIGALNQAGELARGATLYTTLEPCCHHGRTPPCTEAVISSGVAKVVAAAIDPNPAVAGKGMQRLQEAGLATQMEEIEGVAELYEAFGKHILTGLPFVTAKFAMSLDGKIATRTGDSKWITGPLARQEVQQMRRECDAVLVGINTVLADDPQLTVRDEQGNPVARQPLRVILDSNCRTPTTAKLLMEPGNTLVATTTAAPAEAIRGLQDAGAEVWQGESHSQGMVAVEGLLSDLGGRGVVSLLVEGGGVTLGSLFDAGLVDKVHAFVAPVIIGGSDAASPVQGRGPALMAHTHKLESPKIRQIGPDWLISGYPKRGA